MAPTGILYALVARGPVVLAEYSGVTGNAPLVALSLLEKLPPAADAKASYLSDQMAFHVLVEGGLAYLCMTDEVSAAGAGATAAGPWAWLGGVQ